MLKTFFQWMSGEPGPERDINLQRLYIMLNDAEYALKKSTRIREMNIQEYANYEKIKEQLNDQILKSREEILAVKTELVKAKHTQRNRVEYEQIAAKIDQYPTRSESAAKLESIAKEKAELEVRKEAILKKLDERRNQFSELIKMVRSINTSLEEDEAEEVTAEGPIEVGESSVIITGEDSDEEKRDRHEWD